MVRVLSPALVALALLATTSCGGGSNEVVAQGVVRFSEEIRGGVVEDQVVDYLYGGTRACAGTGRFSDLVEGQGIVIRNADGEVVGNTQLSTGTTTFRDAATGETIRGVPRGSDGVVWCSMPFPRSRRGRRLRLVHRGDRGPCAARTGEARGPRVDGAETEGVTGPLCHAPADQRLNQAVWPP